MDLILQGLKPRDLIPKVIAAAEIAPFPIPLSLKLIAKLRADLRSPAHTNFGVLVGSNLWPSIIGNTEFRAAFDPVINHASLLEGYLGYVFGTPFLTDCYFHPSEQTIPKDRIYVFPYDAEGNVGRGWGIDTF